MKKLLMTGIFTIVLIGSNMTYAMTGDTSLNAVSADAFSTLQVTRCMVYADLQKNMQTTLYSISAQQISDFGIDDTKSYSGKANTILGHLSIEG
jgi:hypothetical protein